MDDETRAEGARQAREITEAFDRHEAPTEKWVDVTELVQLNAARLDQGLEPVTLTEWMESPDRDKSPILGWLEESALRRGQGRDPIELDEWQLRNQR